MGFRRAKVTRNPSLWNFQKAFIARGKVLQKTNSLLTLPNSAFYFFFSSTIFTLVQYTVFLPSSAQSAEQSAGFVGVRAPEGAGARAGLGRWGARGR